MAVVLSVKDKSMKPYSNQRRDLLQASAALVAFSATQQVQAQAWPAKPITLIAPYPAGGV
jgi:hypothetical protein